MKKLLVLAAIAEAATALALLVLPSLVGRLLFGAVTMTTNCLEFTSNFP